MRWRPTIPLRRSWRQSWTVSKNSASQLGDTALDAATSELLSSLRVGDEIMTTSGIFGTITGEDGPERLWLEIDDDVQIRVLRAAIQDRAIEGGTSDEARSDAVPPPPPPPPT